MKYAITVAVLIGAFYLGAHSQTTHNLETHGPTFVTGVSVYGSQPMYGVIDFQTSSELSVSTEQYNGKNILRISLAPGYHIERDKK